MTEDDRIGKMIRETELARTKLSTKKWYLGLLLLTVLVCAVALARGMVEETVIAIPVILLLLGILIYDKDFIHVPPMLIFFAVTVMYLSLASYMFRSNSDIFRILSEFMMGILLGSIGIIVAYMSLGKMPGFAKEKPVLIAIESLSFGIAVAAVWTVLEFHLNAMMNTPLQPPDQAGIIWRMTWISLGSVFVSFVFMIDTRLGIVRRAVIGFLGKNSDMIGMEEDENETVRELIGKGESYELEFKSTLRTNLATGEKDKRMEKAVLKTLVAFLNSDGGDLLVGVADDGRIIGTDIESFDNPDKMNLHISNLLSSQIGDEFIPFIRFRQLDYGADENGKELIVIRFSCTPTTTPVFLKDGKEETFYVRSGPSSIDLSGNDLIRYVDNRRRKMRRKYIAAKPQ